MFYVAWLRSNPRQRSGRSRSSDVLRATALLTLLSMQNERLRFSALLRFQFKKKGIMWHTVGIVF